MKFELTLHPRLTKKQILALRHKKEHLILNGVAGTGKSYVALALGLTKLQRKEIDKIIIIRSAVPTREIGHLPGTIDEKLEAYTAPYQSLVKELTGKPLEMFFPNEQMVFLSTSFLRGQSFDDAFIFVDEAQSMNAHELQTVVTRVGQNSHLCVAYDSDQTDLTGSERHEHKRVVAVLETMYDEFTVINFSLDDIVRSAFVKKYYQCKHALENVVPGLNKSTS